MSRFWVSEQFHVSLDAETNHQHLSLSVGRARGLKIKGKNGESVLIVPKWFLGIFSNETMKFIFFSSIVWQSQFIEHDICNFQKYLTYFHSQSHKNIFQGPMMFMQPWSWERRRFRLQCLKKQRVHHGMKNSRCKYLHCQCVLKSENVCLKKLNLRFYLNQRQNWKLLNYTYITYLIQRTKSYLQK